eukprot:1549915-Rhodomonas_salina.1
MEGAKFKQWQLDSGLNEATLATQGIKQAQHLTQAEFMGVQVPQWPTYPTGPRAHLLTGHHHWPHSLSS